MQTLQMRLFSSTVYSTLKWDYNKYIFEVKQKERHFQNFRAFRRAIEYQRKISGSIFCKPSGRAARKYLW